MAAGEDQPQPIVGNGALGHLLVLVGGGHQGLELAHLVLEAAGPANAVDRLVPRGRRYPAARIRRHAALGPDLERDEERVLYRLLGEVEVAEDPDERSDRPPRLLAEQAIDRVLRRAYRR